MSPEQILEYAKRERYRIVVTEQMITAALDQLDGPFTCRTLVEALPRDDRGCTVSEYLVSLWLANFIERRLIRWTDQRLPRIYARVTTEPREVDRTHCGLPSYAVSGDVEWCPTCGSVRVSETWIEPRRSRDGR